MGEDSHFQVSWVEELMLYRVPLILLGIGLLLFVFLIVLWMQMVRVQEPIKFSRDAMHQPSVSVGMTVDISGAVERPGVYHLPVGSRVEDVITLAGGITQEVDTAKLEMTINRASVLSDGAKLYIPKISPTGVSASGESVRSSSVVSINFATQSELESLVGVGEVTAKKIIDARPYTKIDELVTKKIMSASVYDKIQGEIGL